MSMLGPLTSWNIWLQPVWLSFITGNNKHCWFYDAHKMNYAFTFELNMLCGLVFQCNCRSLLYLKIFCILVFSFLECIACPVPEHLIENSFSCEMFPYGIFLLLPGLYRFCQS
ncbi:hypothetical protein ABZP36_031096 [Zizania latifolia]